MLLAQATAAEFGPALLQTGLAGAMLLWFAVDSSKRMKAQERSTDRLAKAILLQMVGMGMLNSTVKSQAQELLDELNEKTHGDQ